MSLPQTASELAQMIEHTLLKPEATPEDVALMRRTVGPEMGVKAAGGIRTLADAQRMIEAGASRLGASAGVKILLEIES